MFRCLLLAVMGLLLSVSISEAQNTVVHVPRVNPVHITVPRVSSPVTARPLSLNANRATTYHLPRVSAAQVFPRGVPTRYYHVPNYGFVPYNQRFFYPPYNSVRNQRNNSVRNQRNAANSTASKISTAGVATGGLPAYTSVPVSPARFDVRYSNREIQAVQVELRRLGVYTGLPDGVMGPSTQTAITTYQTQMHQPATGLINGTLLSQLGLVSRVPEP